MGGKKFLVQSVIILLGCVRAWADLESTATLPVGVFSPKFTFGMYSGLGERFNAGGQIESVTTRYNKLNLTAKELARYYPKAKELVDGLNSISKNEKIGDTFALPLTFKASPTINYFVPTLSYGVTPELSVGFGIPIIHFQNTIGVSSADNSLAISQYAHGLSPELDKALVQLTSATGNIGGTLTSVLEGRGYKALQNEDWTAPGDLQISAVYRYYTSDDWKLAIRPYVQVPTGRPDDPDDVGDMPTGGQPALGLYSIHELHLLKGFSFISSLGYQLNLQDSATVRVPVDGDDVLPDLSRKETVSRRTGNTVFAEGGFSWFAAKPLELRAVYDFTQKDPDTFQGNHPDWNYSILSQDTGNLTHSIKGLVEFSTVNYYTMRTFAVPFMLGYIYGNTFLAVNSPVQFSHQLYLRMFF